MTPAQQFLFACIKLKHQPNVNRLSMNDAFVYHCRETSDKQKKNTHTNIINIRNTGKLYLQERKTFSSHQSLKYEAAILIRHTSAHVWERRANSANTSTILLH